MIVSFLSLFVTLSHFCSLNSLFPQLSLSVHFPMKRSSLEEVLPLPVLVTWSAFSFFCLRNCRFESFPSPPSSNLPPSFHCTLALFFPLANDGIYWMRETRQTILWDSQTWIWCLLLLHVQELLVASRISFYSLLHLREEGMDEIQYWRREWDNACTSTWRGRGMNWKRGIVIEGKGKEDFIK